MSRDSAIPSRLSRRTFIAGASSAAALSVPGLSFSQAGGPKDPVKIGLIFAKQGTWTEQGEHLVNGARVAVAQAGSKLLDRPVELVWLDEPNPQVAQQNMQKIVDEEKVVAVIGGTNSGTSLAMSSVAQRSKIPFIAANAAARDITGKGCNRYTFRTLATTQVACRAVAPHLANIGKKWYFLVASYVFGLDIYNSMKSELKAVGGTEVGFDQTPLGTTDFSSFILKIRQAKPDVVVLAIQGNDLSNFLKQYKEFGLEGKIQVCNPVIGDSDLWSIGPQASFGIYGKPWHFSDPSNPPADKEFAAAYLKAHGKPAADKAWLGWQSMRLLIGAIQKEGSLDPAKIVTGLETLKVRDGDSLTYFRDWDHQLLHRYLVLKVKKEITDKWDYLETIGQSPINPSGLETLFGSKAEIGCTLGSV